MKPLNKPILDPLCKQTIANKTPICFHPLHAEVCMPHGDSRSDLLENYQNFIRKIFKLKT